MPYTNENLIHKIKSLLHQVLNKDQIQHISIKDFDNLDSNTKKLLNSKIPKMYICHNQLFQNIESENVTKTLKFLKQYIKHCDAIIIPSHLTTKKELSESCEKNYYDFTSKHIPIIFMKIGYKEFKDYSGNYHFLISALNLCKIKIDETVKETIEEYNMH